MTEELEGDEVRVRDALHLTVVRNVGLNQHVGEASDVPAALHATRGATERG